MMHGPIFCWSMNFYSLALVLGKKALIAHDTLYCNKSFEKLLPQILINFYCSCRRERRMESRQMRGRMTSLTLILTSPPWLLVGWNKECPRTDYCLCLNPPPSHCPKNINLFLLGIIANYTFLATVAVENEKTTYADIKPGTKE